MGKRDLGMLQERKEEVGGAPAPPGYWEPARGPATPAGLGLGGFCTAGRACQPPPLGQSRGFTGILGDKIIRDHFFTVL